MGGGNWSYFSTQLVTKDHTTIIVNEKTPELEKYVKELNDSFIDLDFKFFFASEKIIATSFLNVVSWFLISAILLLSSDNNPCISFWALFAIERIFWLLARIISFIKLDVLLKNVNTYYGKLNKNELSLS